MLRRFLVPFGLSTIRSRSYVRVVTIGCACRVFAMSALAGAATGYAQAPGPVDSTVSFAAASVRQNTDGGSAGIRGFPGGRLEVANMPLSQVIEWAYQLQRFELQGGPSWLSVDTWDIIAKMDGNPPPALPGQPDAMRLATRVLLADRFKLVARPETREVDAYRLVLARADRRPGPRLRRSTFDCAGLASAREAAARGGPTVTNPNTPERRVCGAGSTGRRLQVGGSPMSMVASMLTLLSGRRVVDQTGLDGDWDLDISFRPEVFSRLPADPADADAPSLFTALEEELGLKLEPAQIRLSVSVVDGVERPASD